MSHQGDELSAAQNASGEAGQNADHVRSLAHRLRQRVLRANALWILGVLCVLVIGFSVSNPGQFLTVFNIRNIAISAAILLVLSVGQTYVIITGGIDLSVGSVLIFSGVVDAKVMAAFGGLNAGVGAVVLGLLASLGTGLLWGLLNGFLVTKARVPALIVTLGTFGMALGGAQLLTGGVDVRGVPNVLANSIGIGTVLGVPYLVVIAAVVALVGGVVLAVTRFGRHTYAVGSNVEAARRVGIAVDRQLLAVYALVGLLAGLAGFLNLAHFGTTTISGHAEDNLNTIAAVVLGGTSLFGGMGAVIGTVIGVFIPMVLQNGFVIVGIQPFWQTVVVGAVLIAAVYVDQFKRRARP